jgi:predicted nucleic acid-binding protein
VIIEIFRGNKDTLYQICDYNCKITSITVFELYCGNLKENEMIMIDNLPKLNFDNKSAKIAGSIFKKLKKKEGKIPPVKDLLIASTCISNNMLLLTYDNDFKLFEKFGLKVKILE